ncbi:hypothetical protein [Sphingomonas sp.]|uniref:hypothetical protein n=1 Tax=Sphingomonas sp. TaxID=28214 RepID=UPI003CC655DF
MKSLLALATATAALLPLAACHQPNAQERANASAANEAAAENAAAAAAPLPPVVRAEKSFRCKDNSLAFVTFFEGDTQAVVRDTQEGSPTALTAPAAGQPYVAAGGWTMTGNDRGVMLTRPGKPAVSCHV